MKKNLRIKKHPKYDGYVVKFAYFEGNFECGFGLGYGNSIVFPYEMGRSVATSIILNFIDNKTAVEHCATVEDKAQFFAEMVRYSPTLSDLIVRILALKQNPPPRGMMKAQREIRHEKSSH
jgi:hypothetical protein